MKATREQVLAMAREACPFTTEVWPEDEWHFTAADLEAFAHKLQQFERDQLRAQGSDYWAYVVNNSHTCFSATEPPDDAYDEGTLRPLFTIPETLE